MKNRAERARKVAKPKELDRDLFGHNIRLIRNMRGISQTELAQIATVNRSSVYLLEKGRTVRITTMKKVCKALEVDFTMTCNARHTGNIKPKDQSFVVHWPEETVWHEWGEQRRMVPPDNQALIQDPQERARLGRNGLVAVFISGASFIMPNGPGCMYIEVFGPYRTDFGGGQYRDGMMHCLRGEVKITIDGTTIHMRQGTIVGYDNKLELVFELVKPLGSNELPPLLLWMGANRVGKIPGA